MLNDKDVEAWRTFAEKDRGLPDSEPFEAKYIMPLILVWRDESLCQHARLVKANADPGTDDIYALFAATNQATCIALVNLPEIFLMALKAFRALATEDGGKSANVCAA